MDNGGDKEELRNPGEDEKKEGKEEEEGSDAELSYSQIIDSKIKSL